MGHYGVTALVKGVEHEVYDGTDYAQAERKAVAAHRRWRGRGYVTILLDGGTWRSVAHVPGDLSTARVTEAGFCLHPRCGEISPLFCYCEATMSAQEKERYVALETCTGRDACAWCRD